MSKRFLCASTFDSYPHLIHESQIVLRDNQQVHQENQLHVQRFL
ncbi:hypothetical protein [Bacillus phage FI_KG-Lek]|nr:hypothetical protein [Bacillus phage FI_KG-Lek]